MASTKLTLQIGLLPLAIGLAKSTSTKIGFKQGFEGVPVKTVRVISRAEKPRTVEEIDRIVQFNELTKLYDAGDKFIPISKEILKKATPASSDTMSILRIIPRKNLPLNIIDGSHYFLEIQKNKQKLIPEDSKIVYTMLYEYLKSRDLIMITNYSTRGSTKAAVIYPAPKGLRLANIVPENLQRHQEQQVLYEGDIGEKHIGMFEKMVGDNNKDEIDKEELIDNSYAQINDTIEKILAGEEIPDMETPVVTKPQGSLLDLLAAASE
ncbi:hypothetical protein LCGC14_0195710 [marine sediment metagenome]|uniref:Ku domain-containing protein n=1 Tax=marine sediment metagenome TaxID=412755 RepID=A0A0F9XNF3_9ZZZZ